VCTRFGCNQAIGLYEPALQPRFVTFYLGREIPFVDGNGTAAPLRADIYDAVYRHVNATKGKYALGLNRWAGRPYRGCLTRRSP